MTDYGRDLDIGKPTDGLALSKLAILSQAIVGETLSDEDMQTVEAKDDSGR